MPRLALFAAATAAGLALSLPASTQDAPNAAPAVKVRLAKAELREIAPVMQVPASVLSRHDSRIAAEAAGRVVFVAEAGDHLDAGAPLARIDDAEASLRLRETEARALRLGAALKLAEQDLRRWRSLADKGTAPTSRLEETVAARDIALQDFREAEVAVERAKVELERVTVRAPFAGLVAERLIEVGEYSQPGREIVRLVDLQAVDARARAPINLARFVKAGDVLRVESEGAATDAPVRALIAAGDEVSRTFEMRVDLSEADWAVGAAARVAVPTAEPRRSLAVPIDALVLRDKAIFVMTIGEDMTAARVDVEPGASIGGWVEVTGDLGEGARVVVRGAERLQPGQTVEDLAAGQAAEAGAGEAS